MLHGRTMIEHVYKRTAMCDALDGVVVATCDREIADAVSAFGGDFVMTADTHERASDRVAEAAGSLEGDVFVLVQGDEPMTHPRMIAQIAGAVRNGRLGLTPGRHTLQLLLGDKDHIPHNPPLFSKKISVIVAEPRERKPSPPNAKVYFIGLKDGDTVERKFTVYFGLI